MTGCKLEAESPGWQLVIGSPSQEPTGSGNGGGRTKKPIDVRTRGETDPPSWCVSAPAAGVAHLGRLDLQAQRSSVQKRQTSNGVKRRTRGPDPTAISRIFWARTARGRGFLVLGSRCSPQRERADRTDGSRGCCELLMMFPSSEPVAPKSCRRTSYPVIQ